MADIVAIESLVFHKLDYTRLVIQFYFNIPSDSKKEVETLN